MRAGIEALRERAAEASRAAAAAEAARDALESRVVTAEGRAASAVAKLALASGSAFGKETTKGSSNILDDPRGVGISIPTEEDEDQSRVSTPDQLNPERDAPRSKTSPPSVRPSVTLLTSMGSVDVVQEVF